MARKRPTTTVTSTIRTSGERSNEQAEGASAPLLFMPFQSDKQRRAMYAAASGNSTIGIPKDVARKFIKDSETMKMSQALRKSAKGGK